MISESQAGIRSASNSFTVTDVAAILRERGWLREEGAAVSAWLAEAAALLGPHAADHSALADLLALVFEYDARAILAACASQEVLSRAGTREVLRELGSAILNGGPVDSNRLKEIVNALKARTPYRSRDILLPLRMAVAGRVGSGELDRVILLLDCAAQAEGLAPVKSVRARILEFCSALD
jgi:hypothetical protein